jgi:hypothetical protein
MDIREEVIFQGVDSWEAEMTYGGRTYKVEVTLDDRKGRTVWSLEVLQHTSRWLGLVQPLYWADYPTLEAAIEGARRFIWDTARLKSASN